MHTYAYTLMTLGVLVATVLVMLGQIRRDYKDGRLRWRFPRTSLNVGLILLLIFLGVQLLPLPEALVRLISPEAGVVAGKAVPAADGVEGEAVREGWRRLSPYAYPVRMSMLRFTVYALFFLGFIQVLESRKRIDRTIWLLVATGCFATLYGLFQTFSGSNHIWWFKKLAYLNDVCGTYINRNHFAGFMEMGVLLAAAFGLALFPRKSRDESSSRRNQRLRTRLTAFLSSEREWNQQILILFGAVVLGVGLIFSASRGGMLAAAAGLLVMGLFIVWKKAFRKRGIVILALFLMIAAYVNTVPNSTLNRDKHPPWKRW